MTLPQQLTDLIDEYVDALEVHKARDLVWEIRLVFRSGERPAWRCFHDGYVHEPWAEGYGWSGPLSTLTAAYDELARALRECIADLKEAVDA